MKQPNTSAIYVIRNSVTGKVYVGSAVRVLSRWMGHKRDLNKGMHHNALLQAAWNKYGCDAFAFDVVETADDKTILLERENFHIARLKAADSGFGYNLCKVAGSQLGMTHSADAKKKMSAAHKGRAKTPEHQAAINASLTGRTLSDEHRAKIFANQTGLKISEQTRQKMREAHADPASKLSPDAYERMVKANVGRKFSDEHRRKIAEANKRRVLSPETRAKISAAAKARYQQGATS